MIIAYDLPAYLFAGSSDKTGDGKASEKPTSGQVVDADSESFLGKIKKKLFGWFDWSDLQIFVDKF